MRMCLSVRLSAICFKRVYAGCMSKKEGERAGKSLCIREKPCAALVIFMGESDREEGETDRRRAKGNERSYQYQREGKEETDS